MKQSPYGSRVLITGVTGGIGLAIAELFIQNGFRVAGCSRHKSETLPEGLSWFSMDVCDDDSVRTCVEQAVQALGGIDILIHCAGMGIGGSVEDVSPEELRHQLDVNTLGFIRTARPSCPACGHSIVGFCCPLVPLLGLSPFLINLLTAPASLLWRRWCRRFGWKPSRLASRPA